MLGRGTLAVTAGRWVDFPFVNAQHRPPVHGMVIGRAWVKRRTTRQSRVSRRSLYCAASRPSNSRQYRIDRATSARHRAGVQASAAQLWKNRLKATHQRKISIEFA